MASGEPGSPSLLRSRALMAIAGAFLAYYLWLAFDFWIQGRFLMGAGGGTVGYDFSCFWGAGRLALKGRAAAAYDWSSLRDLLDHAVGFEQNPLHGVLPFFYPPIFLLVLAPLALLPFPAALAAWLGLKLAAYVAGIRAILPGATATLVALAAPAAIIDAWVGQNGLLTAGLFAGALATLDRRPLLSGMLIGLLTYKPHFGILLPFVLAMTGRWRVFAAAAATLALLFVLAGAIFGWDVLVVALDAMVDAGRYHLVEGDTPWFKLQSIYGMLRAQGFTNAAAWSAHIAVATAVALATLWIWRGETAFTLKAASLATAALLLPPYLAIYDLPVLAVPLAFLVRDSLETGGKRKEMLALLLALATIFVLEFAFPAAHEPVGPVASAGLAVLIATRLLARRRTGAPPACESLAAS